MTELLGVMLVAVFLSWPVALIVAGFKAASKPPGKRAREFWRIFGYGTLGFAAVMGFYFLLDQVVCTDAFGC